MTNSKVILHIDMNMSAKSLESKVIIEAILLDLEEKFYNVFAVGNMAI